jgi:hypothetical protein
MVTIKLCLDSCQIHFFCTLLAPYLTHHAHFDVIFEVPKSCDQRGLPKGKKISFAITCEFNIKDNVIQHTSMHDHKN